ncbi:MAG: hypothetical protein L3J15_08025 [Devosiaceae bacterium]|nr:hypothetical protein [Devosiaceae bacterium]
MVFNILPFRTRSPDRDSKTDEIRFKSVKSALEEVTNGIGLEIKGLQKRVDAQLQQAFHIMDMSGEYSERSKQDEQNIVELETQIKIAKGRLKDIEKQLAVYETLQKDLTRLQTE